MNKASLRPIYLALIPSAIILIVWCLVPHAAAAQEFKPLAETPPGSRLGQIYASGGFTNFVNGLFKFAIALGAIAAVLRLSYAGYLYMGQSDMWSHKGQAREIIADVTLGLLLLLAIYLILRQINPNILDLNVLKQEQQNPATPGKAPTSPVVTPGGIPGLQPSGLPENPLDSTFIGAP